MDIEMNSLLKSLGKQILKKPKNIAISKEGIIWTPVDLVKTSFPEKRVNLQDWKRHFEYYSLNLHQSIPERPLPYGLMSREIFEYFFNEFVKRHNQGHPNRNVFTFNSASDFFNKIKRLPSSNKVSSSQRILALEMLLAFESTSIRFKEELNSDGSMCRSKNKYFFDEYIGPAHSGISQIPGTTSNDGSILVVLEESIFLRLAESKKVPIQEYFLKLAGENVTARDLAQFISYQCNSLHKRGKQIIEINTRDLRMVLGKDNCVSDKEFNKSLKRAINLLTQRYELAKQDSFFPAALESRGRGKLYLQIFKPKDIENILCA